jgi:cytochrome c peroxidase
MGHTYHEGQLAVFLALFPAMFFFPEMPENPENPVTIEGADLGRHLFYDPILSSDSSISCGSCHRQENAFSDGGKQFSTGIDKTPMQRNTPPLFNLAWYDGLFWDGRATNLETQVFEPVRKHDEMNLDWTTAEHRLQNSAFYRQKFRAAFGVITIDSIHIANAIAQFERTLLSHNSRYDQAIQKQTQMTHDEYRGFVIMNDQSMGDCLHCHNTDGNPLATSLRYSNNGLDSIYDAELYPDLGLGKITGNPEDNGKFKVPSLRNIAVTGPYMHDGRFETLEEVVEFYSTGVHDGANIDPLMRHAHRGGVPLTADEKRQIVAFLHALTDSSFLNNPAFSNPFEQHP